MYNPHYGFRENPFSQTPDSAFFFPSPKHEAALNAMVYAVRQRKGFVVLTGEIGSGKTTVARTLLRRLGEKVRTAVITNTHLTPKGVMILVLEDLGAAYQPGSKTDLLLQLNDYLLQEAREDHEVVLIIDEAQNLSMSCLEEVRMLSNLETEKEKLIQVILIGQPELRAQLRLARLEQLRQRVAVSYHLSALDREETIEYVLHRLHLARANGRDMKTLFDPACFELIYRYSHGLPRMINLVCDHALLTGFVCEAQVITSPIVEEAIYELYPTEAVRHEQIYQGA